MDPNINFSLKSTDNINNPKLTAPKKNKSANKTSQIPKDLGKSIIKNQDEIQKNPKEFQAKVEGSPPKEKFEKNIKEMNAKPRPLPPIPQAPSKIQMGSTEKIDANKDAVQSPQHVFPAGVVLKLSEDPKADAKLKKEFDGVYNYQEQLDKIKKLKDQGIELKFIVGRGNIEKDANELPLEKNEAWVYSSFWPSGQSSHDPKPNLWVDLQDMAYMEVLKEDLKGTFKEIWIDSSTWNWIQNRFLAIGTLHSLLAMGGKLVIEHIVHELTDEIKTNYNIFDSSYVPTHIQYSPTSINDEEIKKKAITECQEQTKKVYEIIFGDVVFKQEEIYPPKPKAGKKDYFEITKRQENFPKKMELGSLMRTWKRERSGR